jgi:hypothetical protein
MTMKTADLEESVKRRPDPDGDLEEAVKFLKRFDTEYDVDAEILKRLAGGPEDGRRLSSGLEPIQSNVDDSIRRLKNDGILVDIEGKYDFSKPAMRGYVQEVMLAPRDEKRRVRTSRLPRILMPGYVPGDMGSMLSNLSSDSVTIRSTRNGEGMKSYVIGKKGTLQAGMYLNPVVGGRRVYDEKVLGGLCRTLQEELLELSVAEGYARRGIIETDMETVREKSGIGRIEDILGARLDRRGVEKIAGPQESNGRIVHNKTMILTPCVDDFSELERTLSSRISLLRDVARDKGVSFSPIPLVDKRRIYNPACVVFEDPGQVKRREPLFSLPMFSAIEDVRCTMNLTQSSRNSIDPENPERTYEYADYCNFYRANNGRYGMARVVPDMDPTLWELMIFNLKKKHGSLYIDDTTFPLNPREIVAGAALDMAILRSVADEKVRNAQGPTMQDARNAGHEFSFGQSETLVQLATIRSYVHDRDPIVVLANPEELRKVPETFFGTLGMGATSGGYMEGVRKMEDDGLVDVTTVSKYWPKLMGKVAPYLREWKVPGYMQDIISCDMGTKCGSQRLMDMAAQGCDYEEIVEKSWESLCSGRRWLS